jgi:hypothetical protein
MAETLEQRCERLREPVTELVGVSISATLRPQDLPELARAIAAVREILADDTSGIPAGPFLDWLPTALRNLDRMDEALNRGPKSIEFKKTFCDHFYVTTSGNFRTPALLNTNQEVGCYRILFSAYYPFEDMREAATWFDALELNEPDLAKIAHGNAQRLFRL